MPAPPKSFSHYRNGSANRPTNLGLMCQEPNAAPFRRIGTLSRNAQPRGLAPNTSSRLSACGFLAAFLRIRAFEAVAELPRNRRSSKVGVHGGWHTTGGRAGRIDKPKRDHRDDRKPRADSPAHHGRDQVAAFAAFFFAFGFAGLTGASCCGAASTELSRPPVKV